MIPYGLPPSRIDILRSSYARADVIGGAYWSEHAACARLWREILPAPHLACSTSSDTVKHPIIDGLSPPLVPRTDKTLTDRSNRVVRIFDESKPNSSRISEESSSIGGHFWIRKGTKR